MKNTVKKALVSSLVISLFLVGACSSKDKNAAETEENVVTVDAVQKVGVTHINQQELAEKMKNPNTVLIDIRTQGEVDAGYIEGAVHVPITKVMRDMSLLDAYLDKDLVFYCHTGVRVKALTDFLQDVGHPSSNRMFHLKGDMRGWLARGNKVIVK